MNKDNQLASQDVQTAGSSCSSHVQDMFNSSSHVQDMFNSSSQDDLFDASVRSDSSQESTVLFVEQNSEASNASVVSTSTPAMKQPATTVHQQPNWLPELKANFYEVIISPCSHRVRVAVEQDEYLEVISVAFLKTFKMLKFVLE